MLCKQPFVRVSTGIKRLHTVISEDAREFSTPFPCGRCLPCKINYSRVWTHRILLESSQHCDNAFVTLTYNNEHVPHELKPDHLTKFFKRLRKRIGKFRYYAVGEYGEQSLRPHYHFMLFGHGLLVDPRLETRISDSWSPDGVNLGYTYCGDCTKDSARYVTGYMTNKIYTDFDERLEGKQKEFMRCSKMDGGIGTAAALKIAETLKSSSQYDGKYIDSLKYGKKSLPLGGYLSRKISDKLGNHEQREAKFREHQEAIFDEHMNEKNELLYNLVHDNYQKRLNMEKRYKIFKKRNKI